MANDEWPNDFINNEKWVQFNDVRIKIVSKLVGN